MRFKFIVKPPAQKEYKKELLMLKKEFWENIEEEFSERAGKKNCRNLARRAAEEGFDRIIFVGGDGLLNEGINGIMEASQIMSPNFALGLIPTGIWQ